MVVDVRAKGSDFGTPRGDTPAARTMQAPGLVNAGTYGA